MRKRVYKDKSDRVRMSIILPAAMDRSVDEIAKVKGISKLAILRLALFNYIRKFKREEGVKN